mmetsp:Transcript_43320/g.139200  ORF Transcript_43320/g.139200 Transcript_43320/m.139200 type:complete len:646 (-) Transcript_43320:111-2048(-)
MAPPSSAPTVPTPGLQRRAQTLSSAAFSRAAAVGGAGAAESPPLGRAATPGPGGAASCSAAAEELFRSALRFDVLKLHEIGAGAAEGGRIAARRAAAGPVETQLAKALSACVPIGSSAGLGPAAGCGPLLELLLMKAAEAASVGIEDTDGGANGLRPPATKLRSLGASSLIGPIVAVLERLRWLHEVARSSAARSAGQPQRVIVPSPSAPILPRASEAAPPRPAAVATKSTGMQTEPAAAAAPPAAPQRLPSPPPPPSRPQSRSCGVQSDAPPLRPRCEVGTQVEDSPPAAPESCVERRDAGAQADPVIFCDVALQTASAATTSCGVQTGDARPSSRDAPSQTEDPALSAKIATVRILRIARMERPSTNTAAAASNSPAAAKLLELPMERASSDSSTSTGGGRSSKAAERRGLSLSRSCATLGSSSITTAGGSPLASPAASPKAAARPSAATIEEDVGLTAWETGAESEAEAPQQPPALRCPAGHGMQWFRRRESFHDGLGGPEAPPSCTSCRGSLGGPSGFHTCALCFRETGERQALCGACSRERRPISSASASLGAGGGGGDVARPWQPQRLQRPMQNLGKSASAGAFGIPGANPLLRPRATASGREWSLVSGAGGGSPVAPSVAAVAAARTIGAPVRRSLAS